MPAEGEYLRLEDFFELDFFDAEPRVLFLVLLPRVLFFALLPRVLFFAPPRVLFFAVLREEREREEPLLGVLLDFFFELLLDFFLAAFFVAITILLGGQMAGSLGQVASTRRGKVASLWTCESFCGYTMRRMTGMRTNGSAMSHVAMQLSVPVTMNLRIADAMNG